MTREEAIELIESARKTMYLPKSKEYISDFGYALEMAIKALEQEPSNDMVSRGVFEQVMWERDVAIEQLEELGYELGQKVEPCEDAISRQAALDCFTATKLKKFDFILHAREEIKKLAPVNLTKTGHWIEDEYEMEVRCSACGEENDECSRYCPNCGAKMQEVQK